MSTKMFSRSLLAIALLGAGIGAANAQSLEVNSTSAEQGATGHQITVTFTNTNPETVAGYQFDIPFDLSIFSNFAFTYSGTSDALCAVLPAPNDNVVRCLAGPTGTNLVLPASDTIIIAVDVAAAAPVGSVAIPIEGPEFSDQNGLVLSGGTTSDGAVNITSGGTPPSNPVYSSDPAPGVTISASGAPAATATRNVVITNTGADGLDYSCTVTGTGFAITSGDSGTGLAANATATVAVEFTFPAAGTSETGTLTCTHNGGTSPVTYPLQADGTTGPGPGNPAYSSNPASGNTIAATGVPTTTETRNVVITNTGADGLDYSCTVTGTGFAITSGDSGTGLAANATATVAVQFTFPADGTTEAGTLTCTHNGNAGSTGTATYDLSATGRAGSRAAPALVPASSLWSQIAMFGLFGALGMLILGLRRGR